MRCARCGFDQGGYTDQDSVRTVAVLGSWAELAVRGIDNDLLALRPEPTVLSPLEHLDHIANLIDARTVMLTDGRHPLTLDLLPEATASPAGHDLPAGPGESADREVRTAESPKELAQRRREASPSGQFPVTKRLLRVAKRLAKLAADHDQGTTLGPVVHGGVHHLHEIGRILAVAGVFPSGRGTVAALNVSDGGVPKGNVRQAPISVTGVVGDRQADRRHHGRRWQAVSLWSSEVIAELAVLGHPIRAGAAGENLTLTGLPWDQLRPGVHLRVGDALLELSVPALPCAKNNRWFSDNASRRIHHDENYAWTRWYASVHEEGQVAAGDLASLVP